jgi:ribosome-binding protein aMBF1 (putative translation factor)
MNNTSLRKSIHHKLHRSLRDVLIKARKDLHLSQRDLAEKLGATHSVIGKIETGDRR